MHMQKIYATMCIPTESPWMVDLKDLSGLKYESHALNFLVFTLCYLGKYFLKCTQLYKVKLYFESPIVRYIKTKSSFFCSSRFRYVH